MNHNFQCLNLNLNLAEHGEGGDNAHYSADPDGNFTRKAEDVDKIEHLDSESESDNGEFITIKVTNIEGNTETEEVDRIKEHHKPRYVIDFRILSVRENL